jgi:hypothetical protein
MLRAIRRDSLREHRLRHLDDIKEQIARPLLMWLDSVAIPPLDGSQVPLIAKEIPIARPDAPLGDTRVEYRRHMDASWHAPPELQGSLFKHAKDIHFPATLIAFEQFANREKQFLSEMAAYFKDFLCEMRPQVYRYDVSDQVIHLQHGYAGTLASGSTVQIEDWWKKADAEVVKHWTKTETTSRARQLAAEARLLRERLRELEYTYDLGQDCEYVGARPEHGRRK